jgi:hypothetical protein
MKCSWQSLVERSRLKRCLRAARSAGSFKAAREIGRKLAQFAEGRG